MAVSLKKPSKVDLTKPDLPRKLPEFTPIHLIDEEETIKSLSAPCPSSDPTPDIEIKHDRVFHIAFSAVIGVAVLAILIALVFLFINNLPNITPSEETAPTLKDLFSEVSAAFDYIINSPVFLLFLLYQLLRFVSVFSNLFQIFINYTSVSGSDVNPTAANREKR